MSQNTDGTFVKILFGAAVMGEPTHVQNATKENKVISQNVNDKISRLKDDMLSQVPAHWWSQHDTDVGLVKSASPNK